MLDVMTGEDGAAKRRTWWAKLQRADRHVAEFTAEFHRLENERNPYIVTTRPYEFSAGTMLEARAEPVEVYRDGVAAIVGDIIFNTRSALDHICVALSGNERSQYPIFESDPWAEAEDKGTASANRRRREDFSAYTKGMPASAIELIRASQPYNNAVGFPPPWLDHLAILNRLSNADKHRRLMALVDGICNVEITCMLDGVEVLNHFTPARWATSGAVVGIFPLPKEGDVYDIHATGGVYLTLQEPQPPKIRYEIPDSVRNIVGYVRHSIVTPLDALVA
jgi:hypothetical protein